jgi:hypothetical protein
VLLRKDITVDCIILRTVTFFSFHFKQKLKVEKYWYVTFCPFTGLGQLLFTVMYVIK